MGQLRDLIGAQRTTPAGMLRPPEYSRLEEGAINDQLSAPLKQIEQAYFAVGSIELVLFLDSHPRHASAFGGHRVTGVHQGLLFHEQLLPRELPLLLRYDRGCL